MIFYILKKCLLFTLHYFFFNFIHLFLATWVFVVAGLSLVVVSGGTLSLLLAGFSLQWLLLWQSLGTRPVGFTSFSLLALWQVQSSQTRDWTRHLHWQANSQPWDHQGSAFPPSFCSFQALKRMDGTLPPWWEWLLFAQSTDSNTSLFFGNTLRHIQKSCCTGYLSIPSPNQVDA